LISHRPATASRDWWNIVHGFIAVYGSLM